MSNTPELQVADVDSTEELTNDLRRDDFKINVQEKVPEPAAKANSFVKPVVKTVPEEVKNASEVEPELGFTAEQVIAMSKMIEAQTRKQIKNSQFNASLAGQVVRKSAVPITDFSTMTLEDVYDLSVPIEAKPFMSADVLAIKLKDTNYEARWANKNPQNLGDKLGKGFTYIVPEDLMQNDGIQTSLDAEGHYCFNDVVAMKIDKATYYRALRAAHERAVSVTNSKGVATQATKAADSFMSHSEERNDYVGATKSKQMEFYDAGITV